MTPYDRNKPLIFLHIPKMGGTSIRNLFQRAFGENLFLHYNEAIKSSGVLIGRQPGKLGWPEIEKLARLKPVCIYGHLRNSEGTGVGDFYPKATQFATVLRDPAEAVISSYFYTLRMIKDGTPLPMPHKSANEWLEKVNSQVFNPLPPEAGSDMRSFLKSRAVMVSTLVCLTNLSQFMRDHFSIDVAPPRLNESERSETVDPEVLKRWVSRNAQAVEFYALVKEMEASQEPPPFAAA